jgi:serine/threonine protein kinase
MQQGTRDLGRSVITQIVGLPRSERLRALQEFFPNDELSQKEMLSLLDLYDALGVVPDGAASGGAPSLTPLDEIEPEPPNAPASALLEVGASYGPYRVVRPLGAGGMGQVFLAEDIRLGRHVALKSLAGKWLASASSRQRLMREARAVGVLAHSNIATLYDVLEDDTRLLLVMEYVDGKTVKEMIDASPMPAGQALRVAAQVAAAIGYAHDRGVIHCDLKPANIQVASDGIAKVLDFGLARVKYAEADGVEKSLTGTGIMLGTPGYVAPERLLSGVLNASGDIYSIGVVLFEMVTGRRLFDRGQTPEHLFDTVSGRTAKASAVVGPLPQGLDDVIERALSVDPRLRYQSAHELSRDVQVILKSLDTASLPLSVPSVAVPPVVRDSMSSVAGRWTYAAAAIGGIFTLLVLAGYTTSTVYNWSIGRTGDFDPEPLHMHFVWGFRSIVAPTVFAVLALIMLSALAAIGRIPAKAAGPLTQRLLPAATTTRLRGWGTSMRNIPVTVTAPLLLVIQLLAIGWLWTRFGPVIESVGDLLRRSADADLSALNPDNLLQQRRYRQMFSLHVGIFAAAWLWLLIIRARLFVRDARLVIAGGLALTLSAFLLMVAPYRLLVYSDAERVLMNGQRCYLVGQRGADGLLFCPAQPPPWSRIVRLDDPQLTRDGTQENMFKEVE